METYTIDRGVMRENLRDYEFRQAIKYAFWWAVGMGSAHILHGVSFAPWLGMVLIAVGIVGACVWVGRRLA